MSGADLSSALAPHRLQLVESSVYEVDGMQLAAAASDGGPTLVILGPPERLIPFEGQASEHERGALFVGPRSPANLKALRERVQWLQPQPLGLRTSAGFGDRLGIATPGHIAAMRAAGHGISPIFAQQSIREMTRSARSPQEVVDDATWGIFTQGWREPFGSDADHLKTREDLAACLPAGYTFWTIDPGDHVDSSAGTASASALARRLADLPWQQLEDTPEDFRRRYTSTVQEIGDQRLVADETSVVRAAVKYGRAVAHTAELYQLIRQQLGASGWELEVAVDETEHVTTHFEHMYMTTELQRLGVRFVSYAPRYLGEFEKGIDYIGDVDAFEQHLALHAAIARQLGPYKLSLHSGSDKLSIYAAVARQTRGLVHLKTAGTSYVEALRTLAAVAPDVFRAIYAFAREAFESARAGYHISGRVERTPPPDAVADADLPALLDQPDARQVLHVTYGQVLTQASFRDGLLRALTGGPEAYAARLKEHFAAHLAPFAGVTA